MNYSEVRAYLKNLHFAFKKYALNKITALLERRGRPQDDFRTIHIVGTNGKGSTAAFLSSILQAAGYRVGLFTSPHLSDFKERFRINGENASEEIIAAAMEKIVPDMQALQRNPFIGHPTYFEALVGLGMEIFRDCGVEFAVVEAGLGGRLDGTNVFKNALPVLTNVGLDHTVTLGKTLTSIALEKVAIAQAGSTLVTGERRPRILKLLEEECVRRNARMFPVTRHFRYALNDISLERMCFTVRGADFILRNIETPLLGHHQARNAMTALAAAREVGITNQDTLLEGFLNVRWPGRFELIKGTPTVIIDGAHNPDGLRAMARTIRNLHLSPDIRIHCVFASMRDKKHLQVARLLAPLAHSVVTTRPSIARAEDPDVLADDFRRIGFMDVSVEPNPPEAFEKALNRAGKNDLVLVTGSLYLAGQIRPLLTS